MSALAGTGEEVLRIRNQGRERCVRTARFLERLLCSKGEPADVRRSAALGLGKLGDRESVRFLEHALRLDRDGSVRGFSALSLAELARAGTIDPASVGSVLQRVSAAEKDGSVNGFLLLSLGVSGDRRALPFLRGAFRKGGSRERGAAALALGLLCDESSVRSLGEELNASRSVWKVRLYCGTALGLAGGREAFGFLRRALEYGETEKTRMAAVKGLAMLGDRTGVPLLVRGLGSRNRLVLEWAVSSVSYYRDIGTVPRLIDLAEKERVASVRALAVLSLGNICETWRETPTLCRLSDHCNWLAARRFRTITSLLKLSAWPG